VVVALADVERNADFWGKEGVRRFLNLLFHSIRVTCLAATVLLLIAIPFFEFLPIVEKARSFIPPEVYSGKSACGCDCISGSRPWYGQFNYWLWLWLFAAPAMVFYTNVRWHRGLKLFSFLVTVGLIHLFIALSTFLHWDIRNAPFRGIDFPQAGSVECSDITDGARLTGAVLFGWIYALIYIGFWSFIRWLMLKGIQVSERKKA
jgi:hypothetical protein